MFLFVAYATLATYEILSAALFVNWTRRQRLLIRCLFSVGVILTIVSIAYWLLNTPSATSIS
jgi:hypothetical protein